MNFDLNLGSNLDTPSFFETAAQERIVPTLLAAFEHSLTVMAARHPGLLLRVHNRRDEAFFLLLFIVERQCLATCDGSLSETLFGLIRTSASGGEMPRHKARYSLFFLVLLPYIQRKLERIAAPSIQAGTDEQEVAREGETAAVEPDQDRGFHLPEEARGWAHLPAAPSTPAAPSLGDAGAVMAVGAAGDWREWVRRVYPWVHAAKEGGVLAFHVLFLFNRTKFSSPWLRMLWLELRRTSPQDLKRLTDRVEAARATRGAWALRRRNPLRALARLIFSGWNGINDNFKMCLLGLVVFVKLADWWYSTESSAESATAGAVPAIPPPSRPLPAEGGIPAPMSREECAICNRTRTNPTAATSGYVYCYPCIFRHVQDHGTCPVSLVPCAKDDLRRLYESS